MRLEADNSFILIDGGFAVLHITSLSTVKPILEIPILQICVALRLGNAVGKVWERPKDRKLPFLSLAQDKAKREERPLCRKVCLFLFKKPTDKPTSTPTVNGFRNNAINYFMWMPL